VPGLTSAAAWPVEPPLFLVLAMALLYWLGGRRRQGHPPGLEGRLRECAFYGSLLVIVLASDTPLDPLADELFAAHMAQHVLLLTVAPPLLVLGAPWVRMWQPLPLGFRRSVAKGLARGSWAAPLRWLAHWLGRPLPALVVSSVALVAWHLPALYDATLRNQGVHDLEHVLFVATSLLLWIQVIDSKPARARLGLFARAVYVTAALVVSWVLAIVLAFAPRPLYSAYATLPHRPGGLTALGDQQLAAGIMWVPGSIAFTIAIVVFVYRWLEPAADPAAVLRRKPRLEGTGVT
jgi:cytochrome c oxidase assembly factor CtaG